MAHPTHRFAGWVFAGLTTLPFTSLAGQAQSRLDDVGTGFAGFGWGATLEQITAARGRPATDTLVRDFRRLVYHDRVDTSQVDTWYLLHPSRGLMAGQIGFTKPAQKCLDVFKRVRKDVERANPKLDKSDEFKGELDVVCSPDLGTRLGAWQVWWGDSGSARISQTMMSGGPQILVYYRSPEADAYVAAERDKRGPVIDGFASFPWGTPRDSIVKRLGPPRMTDSTSSTVSLKYVDLLLGERSIMEFTVSPVEGLLQGTYWVVVPPGRDCGLFYRKFHFALLERFPEITPKVVKYRAPGKTLCESLAEGKAFVSATWKDTKSDAYASADFDKPGKFIKISYVGPTYVAWLRRARQADLKSKL